MRGLNFLHKGFLRMKHFLLSILASFVVNMLVTFSIGSLFIPATVFEAPSSQTGSGEVNGGIFGGLERQANYAEEASKDTYQPPADGKLTERQVRVYVVVLKKTRALQDRLGKTLEKMEGDEQPSLSDIFSGVGDAVRMSTAEMEVVKTAGGNWAEHRWIRDQLRTAMIQKDISDAIKHNYALYQEHEQQLRALME